MHIIPELTEPTYTVEHPQPGHAAPAKPYQPAYVTAGRVISRGPHFRTAGQAKDHARRVLERYKSSRAAKLVTDADALGAKIATAIREVQGGPGRGIQLSGRTADGQDLAPVKDGQE